MKNKNSTQSLPSISKKQIKKNIGEEITAALRGYEEVIGKKRFGKTVKKLSKQFAPYVLKATIQKPSMPESNRS